MSDRRRLRTLVLAGLAIALAVFAQTRLTATQSFYPWILYVGAVALFVAAVRGVRVGVFAEDRAAELTPPIDTSTVTSWVLVALAIAASLGSVVLFRKDQTAPLAWVFHLLSLGLLVAAAMTFQPIRRPIMPSVAQVRAAMVSALPAIGVLAIATIARFWQLASFPYGDWYDEAEAGLVALRLLANPGFRPVYFDETKNPAQFNYLVALSFSFFGANPWAIRLVTALLGIAAVLFAYLLLRRWFGPAIGLAGAFILAVMRYDLTFSRFGIQGIAVPLFVLAAIYFLDRALARKRLADFVWLGMAIGFGLESYIAYRLFPAALAIMLAGLLLAAAAKHGLRIALKSYVANLARHWLVALIALVIVTAPIVQFAVRSPDAFFGRQSSVSIFTTRDQPDLAKAIGSNILRHLEMFNLQGDRNGRHNLPGMPMLDPVSGALFILGVALAIWQFRRPLNFLMLVLFAVTLLGGILSLDFEAPQSLRSIGVIPALTYFITLPIAALWQVTSPLISREGTAGQPGFARTAGPALRASALIVLLAVIAGINLYTFFVKQQGDPSAWAQYSTAETIAAKEIVQHAASDDIILTAVFDRTPTLLFLAGNVTNIQRWTSTNPLPLVRDDFSRGAIMLFDQTMLPTFHEAQRLYPNGKFIQWHAPEGGGPVLYEAVLTPQDLNAVQGLDMSYYQGTTASGMPVKSGPVSQAAVDWSEGQPLPEPFVARLQGTLHVPDYGAYGFDIRGGPGASLWIDEVQVGQAPILLARGSHSLRVDVPGSAGHIEVLWQPPGAKEPHPLPPSDLFRAPVTNSGLLGAYYPTPDWTGQPAFTQVDTQLAFYFHIVPLPRPYSVEWTGKLFAPATGTYQLGLYSVDGSWLNLDGQPVISNPVGHTEVDATLGLTRGWHDLMIRFQDHTGATQIYLYWTPPGATKSELVPSPNLSPPMGRFPASP